MHEVGPFSIPAMRDFVPEKLRPWIVIFIVIIVQLSGGVYLAAVSEMVGSTALLQEDIMMAGYASMVGMGLTFAIMFRLKFRFPSKVALMTCGTVILIANLICMHTTSVPVLVVTCFFAGIFRMWATFECNSTIQLWLTELYPVIRTHHNLHRFLVEMGIYALGGHWVVAVYDDSRHDCLSEFPHHA